MSSPGGPLPVPVYEPKTNRSIHCLPMFHHLRGSVLACCQHLFISFSPNHASRGNCHPILSLYVTLLLTVRENGRHTPEWPVLFLDLAISMFASPPVATCPFGQSTPSMCPSSICPFPFLSNCYVDSTELVSACPFSGVFLFGLDSGFPRAPFPRGDMSCKPHT